MAQNVKINITTKITKIIIPIQFPLKVYPGVLARLQKIGILKSPSSILHSSLAAQ